MAADAGISSNIIFTGPVSREKLANIYLAGDIYMMLSKFDTFGMVVLEAMAAGLPVIISRNVGAKTWCVKASMDLLSTTRPKPHT